MANPLFTPEELKDTLESMILSASGWRKIFNHKQNEESLSHQIEPIDCYLTALSAYSFGTYLLQYPMKKPKATLFIGQDSRPTGHLLRSIVIQTFAFLDITVEDAGIIAIPELLAATKMDDRVDGFFYISASHNPPGYNGFKFGFADGSVVGGKESAQIIALFLSFVDDTPKNFLEAYQQCQLSSAIEHNADVKKKCLAIYKKFLASIAANSVDPQTIAEHQRIIKKTNEDSPLSIVIDFNGSSRITSCDVDYLCGLLWTVHSNYPVYPMNDDLGVFNHAIVPEGRSLDDLRQNLERLALENPAYQLGYMPDCDGDRGNLVAFNYKTKKAQIIDAQTVFALCSLSELAYLDYLGYDMGKVAIVCNDATSLRITAIAQRFGATVFTCETGEANVVARAALAREEGYTVRLLGEGSNGGNITYPATVRDPLNSINSILNLLSIKSDSFRKGLLERWYHKIGWKTDDGSLCGVIDSLPSYTTTSAFEADALMQIAKKPKELKMAFDLLFPAYWPSIRLLLAVLEVDAYQQVNCEGTLTHKGVGNRHGEQSGGLKILFTANHKEVAFIWFRGSKTEPVMRLMADISIDHPSLEQELKDYLRAILKHADRL